MRKIRLLSLGEAGVTNVGQVNSPSLELLYNYITTTLNLSDLISHTEDILVDKEQKIFAVFLLNDGLDSKLVERFLSDISEKLPNKLQLNSDTHTILALSEFPIEVVAGNEEFVSAATNVSTVGVEKETSLDLEVEDFEPSGIVDDFEEIGPKNRETEESIVNINESCPKCKYSVDPALNLTEALKVKCPNCGNEFEIKLMTDKKDDNDKGSVAPPAPSAPSAPPAPPTPPELSAGSGLPGEATQQKESVRAMECLACDTLFLSPYGICPLCESREVHAKGSSALVLDETIGRIMERCESGKYSLDTAMDLLEGLSQGKWVGSISDFNIKINAVAEELALDSGTMIQEMEKADLLKSKDGGIIFDISGFKDLVKKMAKDGVGLIEAEGEGSSEPIPPLPPTADQVPPPPPPVDSPDEEPPPDDTTPVEEKPRVKLDDEVIDRIFAKYF